MNARVLLANWSIEAERRWDVHLTNSLNNAESSSELRSWLANEAMVRLAAAQMAVAFVTRSEQSLFVRRMVAVGLPDAMLTQLRNEQFRLRMPFVHQWWRSRRSVVWLRGDPVPPVADDQDLHPTSAASDATFGFSAVACGGIIEASGNTGVVALMIDSSLPREQQAHCLDRLVPSLYVAMSELMQRERETRLERMKNVLSQREREVAHWIGHGKTNPEIAAILGVSAATIKRHVENLLDKLSCVNRTSAVSMLRDETPQREPMTIVRQS